MPTTKQKLVTRLSDVKPEPVEWLWPGRIAIGTIALLDGDPGQGKSLLTLDLAARLTTGRALPDASAPEAPAPVVLLSSEDSLQQTVLPRLQSAEADLNLLHILRVGDADGSPRLPLFPADADLLAETIREVGARLVILDPVLAFLSADVGYCNDQLLRQALAPLVQIATQTRAALLLVRHLTKGKYGRQALYRGAGAMALIGAARTAQLVGRHPEAEGQHLLTTTKCNLTAPPPTLAYRVGHNAAGQPSIDWLGPVDYTAEAVVRAAALTPVPVELTEAIAFLQETLAHGPVSCASVLRQAQAVGITQRTLERAKSELAIHSEHRRDENERRWYWSLPAPDDSDRIMRDLFPAAAGSNGSSS